MDLYEIPSPEISAVLAEPPALAHFQQQPTLAPQDYRERHPVNVLLDSGPFSDISLPETLSPDIEALNSSYSVAEFFILDDGITGVLALGSFSAKNYTHFGRALLAGLKGLREKGAEQLIVDVVRLK